MSIEGVERITIDFETADRIVVESLKQDYRQVCENIRNIEKRMREENYGSHDRFDYKYDKKLRKAIKRVLSYYMTIEEVQKFIKDNK